MPKRKASNLQGSNNQDLEEAFNSKKFENRRTLLNLRQNPEILKNYVGNERYFNDLSKIDYYKYNLNQFQQMYP